MARVIGLLVVLAAALFLLATEAAPATDTDAPQGWTTADRVAWYTTTQGSRLIPRAWLDALEQPNGTGMFLDPEYIASFRYLPNPTTGFDSPGDCPYDRALPLGFAVDCQDDSNLSNTRLRWKDAQSANEPWIGMNCSACHTAEMTYQGTHIRADGGPTLADFQSFTGAMETALRDTADDPAKFNRFANRVLGPNASAKDNGMLIEALNSLNKWNSDLAGLNAEPTDVRYGFGRLDAIGHIFNKVSLIANPADAVHQTSNPSDAPVSYPFLWNVPQLDNVEWNGSAPRANGNEFRAGALVRNTGEVIGVFGDVTITPKPGLVGYVSSVNVRQLQELETALTKLLPPKWPAAFPPVNQTAAVAGGQLFKQKGCVSCHALPTSSNPLADNYTVKLQPVLAGPDASGTDMWMACNAIMDGARTGRFAGNNKDFIGSATFGPTSDSFSLTANAALGVILGKPGDTILAATEGLFGFAQGLPQPRVALFTPQNPKQARAAACMAHANDPQMVYKGRPLQGIWATAPYLHNGSVPNLWEVLLPPAQRSQTFKIGTREFDPAKVGYVTGDADGNTATFDTRLDGNANTGHDYGNAALNNDERAALVEYMKTL